MCLSNILQLVSTGALIVTLSVLIWYACETRGLRKETVKQTELSQRPYLILTPTTTNFVYIENIGHGHALDVSIDILKIDTFLYRFDPCHLVRLGKKVKVKKLLVSAGAETDERVRRLDSIGLGFPYFIELDNKKDYPLTVRYENMEGTRYYTQLEVRVHERRVIIKKSDKDKKPRS